MAGWHHRLDGREFESTLGAGDGQGGLACCSSWPLYSIVQRIPFSQSGQYFDDLQCALTGLSSVQLLSRVRLFATP